uniref:Uncharacterized protein n=1 Tax=Anaerolinea thermolimosa TaxID=229919 RepID=A0A7C4KKF8_9CHLR
MPLFKVLLELFQDGIRYLYKRLSISLGIAMGGVGVSFLFTRGFTWTAFSERLVWVGIALNMVALIILMAQMSTGKEFGVSSMVRSPAEARRLMENNLEIREKLEKRYDAALLIWLTGMSLIGIGALVEVLFVSGMG